MNFTRAYCLPFPARQRTGQTPDTSLTVIWISRAHMTAVSGTIERPYYVPGEIDRYYRSLFLTTSKLHLWKEMDISVSPIFVYVIPRLIFDVQYVRHAWQSWRMRSMYGKVLWEFPFCLINLRLEKTNNFVLFVQVNKIWGVQNKIKFYFIYLVKVKLHVSINIIVSFSFYLNNIRL